MSKPTESEVRRSLSKRWYSLKDRCMNPEHPRFPEYGGSGVTISPEWMDKEKFINSVKKIPGYDENLILGSRLQLDKDSIIQGNKVYSQDTCCFLTIGESNKQKPNQMHELIALDSTGKEYKVTNQSEFAKQNGLSQGKISDCVNGRSKTHKGWVFRKKE